MRSLLIAGCCLLSLAACQTAAPSASTPSAAARGNEQLSFIVKPGENVRLDRRAHFDERCEWTMDPMYEVVPQPSKGVATIEPLEFAVGTVTNQSRQHCVGRTARGRAVYYQAHADAQGEETFQILLNRGRDFAEVYDVKISIIP